MDRIRYVLLGNDYKAKKKFLYSIAKKYNIELRVYNELQLRTKHIRFHNLTITKSIFGERIGCVFEYFDLYNKTVRSDISKFIKLCDFDIFILAKSLYKLTKYVNMKEEFEIKEFKRPIDEKEIGRTSLELLARKYKSPMDRLPKVQEHKSLVLSKIDKRMTVPIVFAAAVAVIENIEVE